MADVLTTSQRDHSQAALDGAHSHGGPEQEAPGGDRAHRFASYDVADFAVPNGREEEWRFTPLKNLAAFFQAEPSAGHLDWTTNLPDGVTLTEISADEARTRTAAAPGDLPAAAALAHSAGAVVVTIPAGLHPAEPVRLDLTGRGGEVVWGHIRIEVGEGAQATVVVEHSGIADYSSLVGIDVADGGHLTLVSIQDWELGANHLAENTIVLGKDATCKHVVVTFGGSLVRISTNARFAAEGGDLELVGLYFTDSGQHHEHRLFVDHAEPRCRSRATYKGALQGAGAHSVWVGDVLIRAEAEGTDTYELNRNLVLTPGARADSVPNLEIETGEIEGAGHASATGRFDDEQLFYLCSRGIPEAEARRLVVHGFFAELVSAIGVPEVEAQLLAAIERELSQTPAEAS